MKGKMCREKWGKVCCKAQFTEKFGSADHGLSSSFMGYSAIDDSWL